jgi:hypothetical protein
LQVVGEIEAGPTPAQDKPVRIVCDLAQECNVAVVSRLIDRAGELLVFSSNVSCATF